MKALIFNSGVGNRMGDFTRDNHKSMAVLSDGETIFGRQLRLLAAVGITQIVVTTGPHVEQLRGVAAGFPGLDVSFVANDVYDTTNYIYSMYLARDLLDDDILMLHGDLVFDRGALPAILADPRHSLGAVNASLPQPDKDFKARIDVDLITEVSVKIHDADCVAFQPLYKLSRAAIGAWLGRVSDFVEAGTTGVYAENALNEIVHDADIRAWSYADHFVNEIDTIEDLAVHAAALRLRDFDDQPILAAPGSLARLPELLAEARSARPLVVGGRSFQSSPVKQLLDDAGVGYSLFSGYSPNPKLPEVLAGLAEFRGQGCDAIVAVGGGSAMDVAKCIKLLAATDSVEFPGFGAPLVRNIPQIAIPTTAGTGSESTHFAVVYIEGEKHSIAHDALLPDYVILEPELLRSLPDYHKKASLLDALAQCVESTWAKDATPQSKGYARRGLQLILDNFFPYFHKGIDFDVEVTRRIQLAANYSGRAINLTKTTAPHAMSYGLTSHYGLAHGHAAALSLRAVWSYYAAVAEDGGPEADGLRQSLAELNDVFGVKSSKQAIGKLDAILDTLHLADPIDVDQLVGGVNAERLGNSPVPMTPADLRRAYEHALGLRRSATPRRYSRRVPGRYEKIAHRDLPDLQAHELQILAQFDEFCTAHDLRYYLSEGSMLGAIRHGGFIPWDDDIDVMMPRSDYQRLLKLVAQGELPPALNLDSFETNPKHWVLGSKIQMTEPTRFVQPQVAHVSMAPGPHIDIFTVDPVEKPFGRKFRLQAYLLRGLRRGLFMSSGRSAPGFRNNLLARTPIFLLTKVVPTATVHKWIVYMLSEFNAKPTSAHWANLCSYYALSRQVFPKEWFGEGRRVPFEGLSIPVPDRAEDMLASIYGPNYGGIPVVGDGHRKHDFYVEILSPSAPSAASAPSAPSAD
ncbi:MAG: iron-containing alcohol dehydrogenase [Tessaracoccus sp.]|uniref:iron-containing alcohol dehydrogenase n=1 Tax=Tessaracoccus sp. TaxID=1971211 RepID=UPI001EBD451C|nr:iron-containing alcohol dehydrogenase [Tessaracoccus sp.]MBK7820141.1 iron-containing alcohol dehydrogenase [Tessaracoccus sp.]